LQYITSEIVGIEISYFLSKFFTYGTLAFRRVNAWPSSAVWKRRCAAAVISGQRHFCSLR